MDKLVKISIVNIKGSNICLIKDNMAILNKYEIEQLKECIKRLYNDIWFVVKQNNSFEYTGPNVDLLYDEFIRNNESLNELQIDLVEILNEENLSRIPINNI